MDTKHIVILGSGFGGIHVYRTLYRNLKRSDVRVTIVSDKDYFWFVPMAHEVATGNLTPSALKQSLRHLPQNERFNFREGTVEHIDADAKKVHSEEGDVFSYDYLIVALGADTDYHNVDGAQEHTIPLRSLDEVRNVKNTILSRFEAAEEVSNPQERHDLLHFVIVGGGPTGVELAGELADMKDGALSRAYPECASYMSISLFQGASRLVPQESEWISEKIQTILEKKGIDVRTSQKVSRVDEKGVWSGEHFSLTRTAIWTAGVRARDIDITAVRGIERGEKHRRIHVSEALQVPEYRNLYVVGDQAFVERKDSSQPYPMRAQFAVRQGKTAARNIMHMISGEEPEEFHWRDKGFLISLGKGDAVARVFGIELTGRIAWFLYRTAYLPQVLGWRAKLRIMFEWTLNLFLPRDLSEI
ncbi:MAG: NAD(P)/FAD-dependent oxidoreductase [Candidatus Paceibacterota bacterium]